MAHKNAGVYGECRVSHGACETILVGSSLLSGAVQTAYPATAFVEQHKLVKFLTPNTETLHDSSRSAPGDTLNPKPETRNPKPETRNPDPTPSPPAERQTPVCTTRASLFSLGSSALSTVTYRRWNNLKRVKDFYLKARARIWP